MLVVTLTQSILQEVAHYDPVTGDFRWRERDTKWFISEGRQQHWNSRFANQPIGAANGDGYLGASLLGHDYKVHHLIWLYVTGEWPATEIDHENHIRTDHRWLNLKEVTKGSNCKNRKLNTNNKSGISGVLWQESRGRWQADIGNPRQFLGRYKTLFDACCARKSAEARLGYHANHGTPLLQSSQVVVI